MSSVARRSSPPAAQQARELGGGRRIDDPPLVMAGLGPGIGEQHEDALEAGVGQGAQQQAGVVDHHAEIAEPRALGVREQARDAGDVGLAADQADLGVGRGLRGEMLAGAEADLEPQALAPSGNSAGGIDPRRSPAARAASSGRRSASSRRRSGRRRWPWRRP